MLKNWTVADIQMFQYDHFEQSEQQSKQTTDKLPQEKIKPQKREKKKIKLEVWSNWSQHLLAFELFSMLLVLLLIKYLARVIWR